MEVDRGEGGGLVGRGPMEERSHDHREVITGIALNLAAVQFESMRAREVGRGLVPR